MILTLESMRKKILDGYEGEILYRDSIQTMIDNGIWIDEEFYATQKDNYGDIDVSSVINCENLDCIECHVKVCELDCSIDRIDISGEISFKEFKEYYLKTLQLALQKISSEKRSNV